MSASDTIGYKHPPVDTRWKPGQSGNPKGRPPNWKLMAWALRNQHNLAHLGRTKQGRQRLEQLHRAYLRHYLKDPEFVIFGQQLAGAVDEIVWERVAEIILNPRLAPLFFPPSRG